MVLPRVIIQLILSISGSSGLYTSTTGFSRWVNCEGNFDILLLSTYSFEINAWGTIQIKLFGICEVLQLMPNDCKGFEIVIPGLW